jgi:hypothetical protein
VRPVGGSSATNGIDDSFTGGVSKQPVQMGITDVEPTALVVNNYPSAYKTSVYGHATASQLSGLTATTIFDQVFGIFVNTTSAGFTTAEKAGQGTTTASLSLPQEAITNILQGNSTDWSHVPDTTGAAVTGTTSTPITIINREQGSGSRTSTDIFFTGDHCAAATPIAESTAGTADFFSTGNVLAAANTVAGSITYASIDNAGSTSFPNLTLVAVNGVQPSNLNAASGEYGDWFEATAVTGSNFSSLSAGQQALINVLTSSFQTESSAPQATDVLAIPGVSTNAASLPVSGTLSGKIYINAFTRSGVSCNTPLIGL